MKRFYFFLFTVADLVPIEGEGEQREDTGRHSQVGDEVVQLAVQLTKQPRPGKNGLQDRLVQSYRNKIDQ